MAHDTPGLPAQHVLPVRRQGLHPHGALHTLVGGPGRSTRGRLLTTLPACRPVARAGVPGTHIGVGQNRHHAVLLVPVRGKPPASTSQDMGGQLRNIHRRKYQQASVVDDLAEVDITRSLGPADEVVARLLMPIGRTEHQAAEAAVARRGDPVAHPGAGCARLALGMPGRHHRPGQALVLAVADQLHGDLAKVLQRTCECLVGIVPLDDSGVEAMRPWCRKDDAERRGKTRQGRTQQGTTRPSRCASPRIRTIPAPGRAALGNRRRLQPINRRRGQMSKANSHGPLYKAS